MIVAIVGFGFIGRQLADYLVEKGYKVKVVTSFPIESYDSGLAYFSYKDLKEVIASADAVINCAVLNNNGMLSEVNIDRINVALPILLARYSRKYNARFICLSSYHAINPFVMTRYAISKRKALVRLNHFDDVISLVCPFVTNTHHKYPKGILFRLYRYIRSLAPFRAVVPSVSVSVVGTNIIDLMKAQPTPTHKVHIIDSGAENNFYYRLARLVLNCVFACITLTVLLVLLPVLLPIIRHQSRGSFIYKQERLGRFKSLFSIYKLRTMDVSTVSIGSHLVPASSITSIGRVLRISKLDEFPQAINVIKGDLFLVGPRPCLASQSKLITARDKENVYDQKPGITGLAQVLGVTMESPKVLALFDSEYLKIKSVSFDLLIVFSTFLRFPYKHKFAAYKDQRRIN